MWRYALDHADVHIPAHENCYTRQLMHKQHAFKTTLYYLRPLLLYVGFVFTGRQCRFWGVSRRRISPRFLRRLARAAGVLPMAIPGRSFKPIVVIRSGKEQNG